MNRIEFEKQLEQNIMEYENAREFIWRRKAIMELTNVFETFNINATLFCSSALFFTGIVDDFNDIDILVSEEQYDKAMKLIKKTYNKESEERFGVNVEQINDFESFEKIAQKLEKSIFASNRFSKWTKKDGTTEIDLISGFNTAGVRYNYKKDDCMQVKNIKILKPEVQYVLYRLMEINQPKRYIKRKLLEEYLIENSDKIDKNILERELKRYELPTVVRSSIKELLEKC